MFEPLQSPDGNRELLMRHMSERERRRRAEGFLKSVIAIREPVEEKKKDTGGVDEVSENSVYLVIEAARHPEKTLLELYEGAALHPAEGKRALDDLRARGMIWLHRLARKGRGGQPWAVQVIGKGLEELKKRGIAPTELEGKGSWKHRIYVRHIGNWRKKKGDRFFAERKLGVKTFDGVSEDRTGQLIGYEVCLTGSARWNASQALKAASVEGVKQVIVACEDRKLLKGIERELLEQDALGLYREKIECRHLSEYI